MSPAGRADGSSGIAWIHDVRDGDELKCRFGRKGGLLVADWPGVARFTCDERGTRISTAPSPGASRHSVAKLRGVVRVLLGDLRGALALHASSVALGNRAVLFMGESNAGKSTAAAELCLHHGAHLLSDDVALLEPLRGVVRVMPSDAMHYLTPQAGRALGVRVVRSRLGPRGKAAIRPLRRALRAYPLALVALLQFDDTLDRVQVRPLRGAEAAHRVLGSMFRFDLSARDGELDRVMQVYEQARFVQISRPHGAPSVMETILKELK